MNEAPARRYEPIAVGPESTVVAEYIPDPIVAEGHQSEAELEREFIGRLQSQAYEYLRITSEAQLIANLRAQLEKLNDLTFSDAEWGRFFTERVAAPTTRPRQDPPHPGGPRPAPHPRRRVDAEHQADRQDPHPQQPAPGHQPVRDRPGRRRGARSNRYDVTVLVNGLPLVHIELKRRGVDIREAFNQINRYQRDSFWAGSGLFDYVQVFVISNGTLTKYYSNTTRRQHLKEMQGKRAVRVTSNSFEFTSWWADAQNKPIQGLTGFTKTFFARHTLLAVLTRYCVLTADRHAARDAAVPDRRHRADPEPDRGREERQPSGPSRPAGTSGTPRARARRSRASRRRSSRPGSTASARCCSSSIARTSTTRPCSSTTASRRARRTRTRPPRC
jgi:type I restriction enzyme R subunit